MSEYVQTLEDITMGPFFKYDEIFDMDEETEKFVIPAGNSFYPTHSFGDAYLMKKLPNAKSLTSWIQNYVRKKYGNHVGTMGDEAEDEFKKAVKDFDNALKTELKKNGFTVTDGPKAITVEGDGTHCGFKILKACDEPSQTRGGDDEDEEDEDNEDTKCLEQRKLVFTPNSQGNWKANKIAFDIKNSLTEEMEGGRKRRRRRRKSKRKTKRKTKKHTSKRKTKRKRKTKKRRRRKR